MSAWTATWWLWGALCATLLSFGPVLAQATRSVEPTPDELTAELVQTRIKRVEAAPDLDETAKKDLLDLYRKALDQLRLADEATVKAADFDQLRSEAPRLLEARRAETAALPTDVSLGVAAETTLEQLKAALADAQVRLADAQKQVSDLADEFKRRADRRGEIQALDLAAKDRLAGIRRTLGEAGPPTESPEAAMARRTLLSASKKAIEAELSQYQRELLSYDARVDLLAARRDLAARRLALAEKTAKFWQDAVADRQRAEAERDARQAREAARAAAMDYEALRSLAQENDRLASRRTGPTGLLAAIDALAKELGATNKALTQVQSQFETAKERVRTAGVTATMSLLLRKERAGLPDVRQHRRRIRARQATLAEVSHELLTIEAERDALGDTDAEVAAVLARLERPVSDAERERAAAAARDLIETKRSLLDLLRGDYDRYEAALFAVDGPERALVETVEQYVAFIDEQVLWFRSAAPLRPADLKRAAQAAYALASPTRWREVVETAWGDVRDSPALPVLGLIAFGTLLVRQRRIRRRLVGRAERVRRAQTDAFVHTIKAAVETILIAGAWPFLTWFLAWRLQSAEGSSEFAKAVGAGLQAAAAAFLTLNLVRAACLEGGLGEAHFRWPHSVLKAVRGNLVWLAAVGLPAVFLVAVLESQGSAEPRESLGRLAFIAGLAAFSAFAARLLLPSAPVMKEVVGRDRSGWLSRFRYLWYPLAVGVAPVVALAAAWGYLYTALAVAWRCVETVWLVLGLVVAYATVLRGLFVTRRRLALGEARERQAGAAASGAPAPGGETSTPEGGRATAGAEEPAVSLFSLSQQTRNLVRSVIGVAFLLGLWLIWVDMLPALAALKRVGLWQAVTLADALLCIIVILLTVVLSKNIPGLLEIALLRRLHLEPSVRFAITAVARYLIGIIGLVVAFGTIGVGWSKVQWLAAAITVGLGFGLQEIFANFVSGLIILFERPIRIGDTVTAGDVTGTVTRIRIRATTIRDWDRKELIVPNKEFITGRLVNWTLSDTILRLRLPVGVAYGSDTELAKRLLLRLAREHPQVLNDPEPTALFLGFGDNALSLELRVFIPDIAVYLRVLDDLNAAIERAFRDAGIVIAFPQRDVHMDTVRPLEVRIVRERRGAGPQA